MADTKISAFTAQDIDSAAEIPFVSGGSNYKAGLARCKNAFAVGPHMKCDKANDYILPYGMEFVTGSSAGTPTTNRLYAQPIFIPKKKTVTRIGCQVAALHASGGARMGIYAPASNGIEPGALILDAGTISQASTGEKEITISQALDLEFYFLAWVCDAVTSNGMRVFSSSNYFRNGLGGVSGLSSGDQRVHCFVAHTYGALPDPFGSPTWSNSFTGLIAQWLRVV